MDCVNDGTVNITHTIVQTDSVFYACGATLTGNPLLEPFGDYGGETATLALHPTSPALDAGDDATCAATDQRGFARPQGPGCDMGAYEYERPLLTLVKEVTPGTIDPGDSVTYTLRFANDGGASAANVSITDTVPGQMINLNDAWAVDGGLTVSRTIDTSNSNFGIITA